MAIETTIGERLAHFEGQVSHLATKADLAALDGALSARIASLEAAMANTATTADVAALQATMTTAAWALGLGIALLGALQVYAVRRTVRRTEQ
ncbi:MAG: hypothetical protein F4089_07200 [Gammaproteobacteria bacterium]|nr:hypothetical protein [Acidobacteriota bacterium]MYA15263.1 hypothetical protein [Gammaproteobacteria bacterium]MYJ74889.1 hypothetical protein [Gammaproteobacteria bacterium]